MRIIHRVSKNLTAEAATELVHLDIPGAQPGLFTFEINEQDERWPKVSVWVVEHGAVDIVSTAFSPEELDSAGWLELVSDWHHGYPQPDDENFGYLSATYDLSDYCRACGIGKRQVAPFQMKKEPKWGRHSIVQLNWVFDEYFVKPEIWEGVFKGFGVRSRPVHNRKGEELETVVQLVLEDEVEVGSGSVEETCPSCGATKFNHVTRGPSPPMLTKPPGEIARSRQWFGSGARAQHLVYVSQQVRQAMKQHDVKGASFRVVAD